MPRRRRFRGRKGTGRRARGRRDIPNLSEGEAGLPSLTPSGLPSSIPTPPKTGRLGIPDFQAAGDKKKKRRDKARRFDRPKDRKRDRDDVGIGPPPKRPKREGPPTEEKEKKKRKDPFKKGPFDVKPKGFIPETAPSWWKPLTVNDPEDANAVLAGALNALIPHSSPKDRQGLVLQLQSLFPGKFKSYSIAGNVTQGKGEGARLDPSQFQRSLTGQVGGRKQDPFFQSRERAANIARALKSFRNQSQLKGASSEGIRFLTQVAALAKRFGTIPSAQGRGSFKQKNFEEMMERLLETANTPELAPFAQAARAIVNPSFPRTRD